MEREVKTYKRLGVRTRRKQKGKRLNEDRNLANDTGKVSTLRSQLRCVPVASLPWFLSLYVSSVCCPAVGEAGVRACAQ